MITSPRKARRGVPRGIPPGPKHYPNREYPIRTPRPWPPNWRQEEPSRAAPTSMREPRL